MIKPVLILSTLGRFLLALWRYHRRKGTALRAVEAARHESVRGRERAVNRRYDRNRREGRLGGWYCIAFVLLLFGVSCRTTVDAPPHVTQYQVTSKGVDGWFVPAAVHADLTEAFEIVHQQKKAPRGCGCK